MIQYTTPGASRRIVSLLLSLGLLALLGCGGKHSAAVPAAGGPQRNPPAPRMTSIAPMAVPLRQTSGVFTVKVKPQPAIVAPRFAGDPTIKQPSAYPATVAGTRQASDTSSLLTRQASEFDSNLPLRWVAQDFAGAKFTPNWTPAAPNNSMVAYATYRFSTTGYSGTATVGLTWMSGQDPQDFSTYFVAIANRQLNHWEWFEGPLDGVITLPSLAPYKAGNGDMLVMVALTGTATCTLTSVSVGVPETRGTGANIGLSGAPPAGGAPPPAGSGNLPSSVDHAPQCAPVRNQGQLGSCTAFAIGAGCLDYELGRLYGDKGWNFASASKTLSPRWLYLKTGADQGLPCSEQGRYYDRVVSWVKANGIAIEANAPYLPNPCDESFAGDATGDAAVIKPTVGESIACTTDAGITQIKTLLAQGSVVPVGTLLDQAFMDWTAGSQPWSFQGPQVGGHAMCIVGYDDAKAAFKVRNSWGPEWGENGYIWIAYNSLKNSDAGAMCFKVQCEYSQAFVDRFLGGGGGGDTVAPPTGVTASQGTFTDHVHVTWTAASGATGYKLYRDALTAPLQTLGAVTSFDDTALSDGLSHTYWVKTVKGSQESGFSVGGIGYLGGGGGGGGQAPTIYGVYYTPGNVGDQSTFYVDYYSDSAATFNWTLGGCNPGSSILESPTVIYAAGGTQTISITVTNASGPTTLTGDISIGGGGGAPVANLVPSVSSGTAPLPVILDASGSTAANGIYRFDWDWEGDGTYDYTSDMYSVISVTYPAGTWHTTVKVWDVTGLASEAAVTIDVTGGSQGSYSEFEPNDDFPSSSPITVSGDTGSCGTGTGYPGYDGDADDYWNLQVNQPLTLQVQLDLDSNTGDLDLYLYDSFGNLGAWSETDSNQEFLQVPLQPGIYVLRVHDFAGFSDYALSYAAF